MNSMESFLLDQAVRATLLLAVAFLAAFAMRRSSASVRRLVWVVTAVCLLALPLISPLYSKAPTKLTAPVSIATATAVRIPASIVPMKAPAPSIPWIEIVWAVGAFAVLTRLAAGVVRIWWIRRRAVSAGMTACLESDRITMPMTCGVFRPAILLPAGYRAWPEERLNLVLAHEMVHVRHRDCMFQVLMQIACALYWFHPLVWLAAARLRIERERASDDGVLRQGIDGAKYAEHLLEMVRAARPGGSPALAVAMANPSHLESRLVALLDAKVNRSRLSRRNTLIAILAAAILVFPLASIRGQAPPGRASISGVVYDMSGAANPHATVLATNLDTNTREEALAGEAGEYSLASVPAGHYMLDVSSPGFTPHRSYVTVKANDHARTDIILEIGNINENVQVVGKKPAALQTQAAVPHRIRVGGNVVAAKLVSKVPPIYPAICEEKGIEGAVLLEAVISTDGSILSLRVVNTADADLARAATTAVQQWRYQPTLLNGEPVEVVTTITVDFRLKP